MSKDGEGESKGGNGVTALPVDTIILTFDRARDHLEIGGKCHSLDLMLDMLGRALRVTEGKYREQAARQLRAALAEEAENARVAASLRGGR